MTDHLTGWRLSAGDEHTIFDGRNYKLAVIPCGGMAGRTFKEATECAARIVHCVNTHDALVKALEGCIPSGVCLTNSNIPDDTIVPIDATMGELRAVAAALALAKGEGE